MQLDMLLLSLIGLAETMRNNSFNFQINAPHAPEILASRTVLTLCCIIALGAKILLIEIHF